MGTAELALVISILAASISLLTLIFSVIRWFIGSRREKAKNRLEFIRGLVGDYSKHNWRFVEYWDFPGVYPEVEELKSIVSPAKPDRQRVYFGRRVVVLEHLNILLRVYTHKDLLNREDIEGYANWAQSWFNGVPFQKL